MTAFCSGYFEMTSLQQAVRHGEWGWRPESFGRRVFSRIELWHRTRGFGYGISLHRSAEGCSTPFSHETRYLLPIKFLMVVIIFFALSQLRKDAKVP